MSKRRRIWFRIAKFFVGRRMKPWFRAGQFRASNSEPIVYASDSVGHLERGEPEERISPGDRRIISGAAAYVTGSAAIGWLVGGDITGAVIGNELSEWGDE